MNKFSDPNFLGQIIEMVARIAGISSTHELTTAMWQFNELLGLSGSVFASFVREDESRESYRFINACPAAWCQEYNANAWYAIDPCLIYALNQSEPKLIKDLPLRSRGQRNMMEAAKRCGFASGAVIPAHSPSGRSRMGVLYLGSNKPDYLDYFLLNQLRLILRAISNELLDWWTRQMRSELLAGGKLSAEEQEMLRLTLDGLGSKEIATHLGTTKNAIDQRMHRLINKLDSGSRRDAASLAMQYGLLS